MKIFKTIIKRLKATTPKFFKIIRNLSIAIALAAGSAATLYATFDDKIKETIPIEYVKYIGVAALTATVISQLTKEDTTKNKKK